MLDVWRRIEDWLSANAPQLLDELPEGASEDDIHGVESALGIELPADLRDSLAIHDGDDDVGIAIGWCLLSTTQIVESWLFWHEFMGTSEPSPGVPDKGVAPVWWSDGWIPVSQNMSGDYDCVDLAPDEAGNSGQVIRVWHDKPQRQVQAASFRDWLEQLADGFESGRYVYDSADDLIAAQPVPGLIR